MRNQAGRDTIPHATTALVEFAEATERSGGLVEDIHINAHFGQLPLDIFVDCADPALSLPEAAPCLSETDGTFHKLHLRSGFPIRSAATRVEATRRGNQNILYLLFEH